MSGKRRNRTVFYGIRPNTYIPNELLQAVENVVKMKGNVVSLFSKALKREIERLGWKSTTRIQSLAIPVILRGKNVLLIAPTGTGKTEAAVFPIFEQFLIERSKRPLHGISILYITPLRALNRDIFRRLIEVGKNLDIKVQVRHGDTTQYARRKQAISPPHMLITTPETFQAIFPGRRMSYHLRSVRWVVVDEVHELATNKRGTQLSLGLERLRKLTSHDFQRVGLSATIGSPELIAKYLCGADSLCRIIRTFESKELNVRVESPTAMPVDRKLAKQVMLSAGSVKRIRRLFELINEYRSSLIFSNTREHAETLASRMVALEPTVNIGVHHGSLSRGVRIEVEQKLKSGQLKAVICTSSLELGIDIGNIEFVVQYLSPKQVTKLLQRIGRSGHVVGGRSQGYIISAWPDDILESAVIAKFALGGVLENPTIHENALDVLAHQVAGLALDWGQIELEEIYKVISTSWLYRKLPLTALASVVKQLEEKRIIWFDGKVVKKNSPQTHRYYYENLSMITNVKKYSVIDFLRRKRIGTLDQEFIAKNGEVGQEFIMRGQTWRLINVDDGQAQVSVEPVKQSFGAIPSWEGEMIPVPFMVAQEVGKIRGEIASSIAEGTMKSRFSSLPLNKEALVKIVDTIKEQLKRGYPVPTDRRVLIEGFDNYAIMHGCFGTLVNEAFSKLVSFLLSARVGLNVRSQADAYRIAFIFPFRSKPESIKEELLEINSENLENILSEILGHTSLFAWRLWNVAKRFGLVTHNADYLSRNGRLIASILRDTPVYLEALREIYVEKIDVETAKNVLKLIHDGKIVVEVVDRKTEYSPLALPILDRIAPLDLLRPALPTLSLIDVVRERLETEDVRLVCIFNGDYNVIRRLRTIPPQIVCPNCKSTLVAAVHPQNMNLSNIVRKKKSKRKLTSAEEKEWRTAWKNASLVQNYGKKAIITLVARGIGPTNAARILNKFHRAEKDFYTDIIRAERDYARTRIFWDR